MGFYHGTVVAFGGEIQTDQPYKTNGLMDTPQARDIMSGYGIEAVLIGAANSEGLFLVAESYDLDTGEFLFISEPSPQTALWVCNIQQCAIALGVNLDGPIGWVVAHEYK